MVNQIVWRFDSAVPLDALESMWQLLATGPLDRSVRRSAVPGARDGWITARTPAAPVVIGHAIARDGIDLWIENEAAVTLDPIDGPAWRLSATSVDGGGTVVSLVGSHVVGDGGALTSAAAAALAGRATPDDFVRGGLDHDPRGRRYVPTSRTASDRSVRHCPGWRERSDVRQWTRYVREPRPTR